MPAPRKTSAKKTTAAKRTAAKTPAARRAASLPRPTLPIEEKSWNYVVDEIEIRIQKEDDGRFTIRTGFTGGRATTYDTREEAKEHVIEAAELGRALIDATNAVEAFLDPPVGPPQNQPVAQPPQPQPQPNRRARRGGGRATPPLRSVQP
jgi:hypothetical protein